MGRLGEEVEGDDFGDTVVLEQESDVAGLSRGVAGEIDDGFGLDGVETFD